jgi:UDP:flavonoid glycosyltransferase YjiC (YdhE family)
VVLATIGTDGDVFPYLALGSQLRRRGYRVTLTTSAAYADLARQRGLEFEPLVSVAEIDEWFRHPDCWHPLKGAVVGARWSMQYLERNCALLTRLVSSGESVLVAPPTVMAARLLHDQLGTPLATVILQPWVIHSNSEPPRMARMSLPRHSPAWLGGLYWGLVNRLGDRLIGRQVNTVRRRMGLPPIRKLFRWWLSPQRVIGLFPGWYGPPQADWPAQIEVTGFPLDDGVSDRKLPAKVMEFLQAGEPPVLFTFGTGMQHANRVFAACLEACRRTNTRGLFLTKHPQQLPQPLPPFACHAEFAPFGTLFPQCAAVTRHGGIGTTAQALASGVPQLIVPFAFDQFDNAARLKRLGVGESVGLRRRGASQIAAALQRLKTSEVRERAQLLAERMPSTGISSAADHVEALFSTSEQPTRLNVHVIANGPHQPAGPSTKGRKVQRAES